MNFNLKSVKNKIRPYYKILIFYLIYLTKITLKSNKNHKKQIIMIFDGKVKQGGLVDRLKGIISGFEIAEKIDAEFKIYFVSPFDLSVFLQPNHYDWTANTEDLYWNPFQTKVIHIHNLFNINPLELIKKANKSKIFLFANVDYLQIMNPAVSVQVLNVLWKQHFDKLFIKSSYLESALKNLQMGTDGVAIHSRFTNILGDFADSNIKEVSESKKIIVIEELKQMINSIKQENPGKSIYVFSDSSKFLNEIKIISNYNILDGTPIHSGEGNEGSGKTNAHLKTFLDFFAISNCNKVYLVLTKDLYNSAFSKYAAIVGGKQYFHRYQ